MFIARFFFRISSLLLITVLSLGALSTQGLAAPANHSPVPTGLSAADWAQVSALLPNYQQAYIKSSNPGANDSFGAAIALSGNTLVIGVGAEDSNAIGIDGDEADNSAPSSGAVYVFTRIGTTWSQQAYIKASNTNANDYFGWAVAISDNTLAVSAVGEASKATGIDGDQADNSASFAGAVYVFTRSGTTWSQQAYIKASNTNNNDLFGDSIALSGDTLVVGADGEDSNAKGINGNQTNNLADASGAVYVFTRSGTTWSQQAYIKASNTDPDDYFGFSVSVMDNTLVAGAIWEASGTTGVNGNPDDNSTYGSGAVYVFTRDGTDWSQQAYIKASNPDEDDNFGISVSLLDDTLAVGAPNEDSNATDMNGNQTNNSDRDAGAVYIFTRSGTTWSQQAYIKAFNTGAGDYFGHSVTLSGDTLAVGAPDEDSNATGVNNGDITNNLADDSGAVYIFTRSGTTWSQGAYVKASNPDPYDRFGRYMAFSNGTLAVGALNEDSNASGVNGDQTDNSAPQAGAAYVFLPAPAQSQQAYIKASNTDVDDTFGYFVALSGDTLAVGVPGESSSTTGVDGDQADNSASGSGAVYVFTRSGTTWSQQAYIKASNTGAGDSFGYSVALSDDTLAASAPEEDSNATGVDGDQEDNSASDSGAVYVFTRDGTVWSQQAYIKASNTDGGDNFGSSVALSGDTLAVGANGEASNAIGVDGNEVNNSAGGSGAVYVFTRSSIIWSQQAYIKASNTNGGDAFGYTLSLSGDRLDVGAPLEASSSIGVDGDLADNSSPNSGAVYVFTRSGTIWSQQSYIKASNTDGGDNFGSSVALSDDTLAVGASQENSSATGINGDQEDNLSSDSGAVYVFVPLVVPPLAIFTQKKVIFTSSGTQDGWLLESSETSSIGGRLNHSATTLKLGDSATRQQYRAILSFNTASIPDNAIITAVTLKVRRQDIVGGGNPVTMLNGFMVDIKKGIFGKAGLQLSDFQAKASRTYGPFKPTLLSGWYRISLTNGKGYINKLTTNGGLTQIRLRFKLDDNNNSIANILKLYSGNAPVASRPKLVITYHLP